MQADWDIYYFYNSTGSLEYNIESDESDGQRNWRGNRLMPNILHHSCTFHQQFHMKIFCGKINCMLASDAIISTRCIQQTKIKNFTFHNACIHIKISFLLYIRGMGLKTNKNWTLMQMKKLIYRCLLLIIRVASFLAPWAFHSLTVDIGVMHWHNGMCCRFLGSKSTKKSVHALSHGYFTRGPLVYKRALVT